MKVQQTKRNLFRFLLCVVCVSVTGCANRNLPSPLNGNWVTTLTLPEAPNSFPVQASFAMFGHYETAVGIARLSGLPCTSPNTPISVAATQDLLALRTKWIASVTPNTTIILNGVQSENLSAVSGTFSVEGTNCGGLTSGIFLAKRYEPLSGSYLGSLVTPQNNSISFLTSLEQNDSSDGSGRYPISGSASITPAQCIANPTIVNSYVFGNAFSSTYTSSNMSQINVTGSFTEDAKTINILTFTISGGPCNGLQAVGTLTRTDQR
jgi:hypothetical protein